MKPANYSEVEFTNNVTIYDSTKIITRYYNSDYGNLEFLYDVESECSSPQFICEIEGFGKIVRTDKVITFKNKLYAQFFTHQDHLRKLMQVYDFEIITPTNPMKENGWADLYNSIVSKTKMIDGGLVNELPIEYKEQYIEHIKTYQTDKSKEEFIDGFIRTMINFEKLRPQVKRFVDKYFHENQQLKFARIFDMNDSDEQIAALLTKGLAKM